ncbi:MAG: UDP-glucose/GDP-mannose dehydrogenase family protein [archaeon]
MKILVIGSGYVGLTVAVGFASFGFNVIGYDIDSIKIENLRNGILHIEEPKLDYLFKQLRDNIHFSNDLKASISLADVIFVSVSTELVNGEIDLSNFYSAMKMLFEAIESRKLIVIKSTVPVGTTGIVRKMFESKFGEKVKVAVNPEFLREGHAIEDFLNPDRIVLGVEDKYAEEILLDLYKNINAPKIVVNFRTAEMIKYASNAFLATRISFINEIANICELYNIDVDQVAKGIGLDKRIGPHFLKAGIGFGGSCLPKDLKTLIDIAQEQKYKAKLLESAYRLNEKQIERFVKKITSTEVGKIKEVGVWGLSFKGGTDDTRESPAIKVIKELLKDNYEISVYDPKALENARKELGDKVKYAKDYIEAVYNKSAVLVLSDWKEFLSFDLEKVYKLMKAHYFFDGRNLFNPKEVISKGFIYYGIGRIFDKC